jgi:hypothetical protein
VAVKDPRLTDALLALEVDEGDDDTPATPTVDGIPPVVDYSVRNPGDWVVSGPLEPFEGPGRVFVSEDAAFDWAQWKYGPHRVTRWYGGMGRWAVLVKPKKEDGNADD